MLFLDEFTEFRRDAVEGLRQPNDLVGLIGDQASAEDSAMLAALMDTGDPGRERMRFLG